MGKPATREKHPKPAPRLSLAATHPAAYGPPPHASTPETTANKADKATRQSDTAASKTEANHIRRHDYPTPAPSPPKTVQAAGVDSPKISTGRSMEVIAHAASRNINNNQFTPLAQVPQDEHRRPNPTVSANPPFWTRNHTVLKSDTDLTFGNVVSPTFMHGLPFGSVVEAAHHYPSEERLHNLR